MRQPKSYRTKDRGVEAMQVISGHEYDIAKWCGGEVDSVVGKSIDVPTMIGPVTAYEGDYIIKRDNGQIAVQTASDFEKVYELNNRTTPRMAVPQGEPVRIVASQEVRREEHERSRGTFFGHPRVPGAGRGRQAMETD